MLIDKTYFVGELNIPNTDRSAVEERIDFFIKQYEPKLLKDLMGLGLYKELISGLVVDPVADKWTELLYGTEYTDANSIEREWMGLVSKPDTGEVLAQDGNALELVAGRGNLYDPVANSTSVIIPILANKRVSIEQRGIGKLRKDEYVNFADGDGKVELLNGRLFDTNGTFFISAPGLSYSVNSGDHKQSLIACYVYYWLKRDEATISAGVGEAKPKAENANMIDGTGKMVKAWNQMVEWNWELNLFLVSRKEIYPTYNTSRVPFELFKKINLFGI